MFLNFKRFFYTSDLLAEVKKFRLLNKSVSAMCFFANLRITNFTLQKSPGKYNGFEQQRNEKEEKEEMTANDKLFPI